ncbi:hypothetical protein [Saccharothrix texasensis]|uniref:Uncharacterized protein n=1 Tax=Saccharothrix texasensis TaxID=103734 RepID=A0A3N1H827_9PSEU|nr:hypothetical protein [Saccharothrix texasensis]ROP38576.1 hypothetical protein EDD40_3934 [Saccharothrix texasensis]
MKLAASYGGAQSATLMRVASTTLAAVTAAGPAAAVGLLRRRTAPAPAFSGAPAAGPPVTGVAALVSARFGARVSARVGSAVPAGRSSS